jgi:uncharacterized protein YPO0396
MIVLKKLELINWHYFEYEVINFGMVNFLTGKNASGKTTLIDAIQLIMLGDTSGHFFNKSAHDKSARTLNGYLRCEIGTDDYGNPTYKRAGHFHSYVVAEFYDDENIVPFVLGIVFENFDDATYQYKFFTYEDAIPESTFIVKNYPVVIKDLKTYIYKECGKEVTLFETNTNYRDYLRHRFGNLATNYFSLFKKAIPFAPISNIETFINEYVCDVENEIDLDSMQESIRKYTQLEAEAANLEKRLGRLGEINSLYQGYKDDSDRFVLKRYVYSRCEKQVKSAQLQDALDQLNNANEEIETYQTYLNKCQDKIKELEIKKQKLLEEKASSNDVMQKANLENQKAQLEAKQQELQGSLEWAKQNLMSMFSNWRSMLQKLTNLYSDKSDEIVVKSNEVLEDMARINPRQNMDHIEEKDLTDLQVKVNKLKNLIFVSLRTLNLNASTLSEEVKHIESELSYLSSGKKMYDRKLLKLQEILMERLSAKYNKRVRVEILADILEIKSDTWRRVIETYLGAQRFYLFVEPKYVEDSLRIYDEVKETYGINDVGIVDTEKIAALNPNVEKNALSEEIFTNNSYARIYIDNLLGTLIKCGSVDSLRSYRRSVTSSGMLYQNYVARQLNFERTTLFIGENTIKDTMKNRQAEYSAKKQKLDEIYRVIGASETITTLDFITTNEVYNVVHAINAATTVSLYEEEIKNINFKLKVFGSNEFIKHIDSSIAKNDEEIAALRAEEMEFVSNIGKLKGEITRLGDNVIPQLKASVKEADEMMKAEFNDAKLRVQGEALFQDEMEHFKTPSALFSAYTTQIQQINNQLNKAFEKIMSLRVMYNTEYRVDYDVNDRSNENYQTEYDQLSSNALVDYKVKIKEAKEVALWQFKDNFLAKLKANFDMVNFQISNLNYALANSKFGTDSYTFTVTPRHEFRDFYEMINDPLLLEGKEIFSTAFQEKYGEKLEELFSYITNVNYLSNTSQTEIEQNIARYTDYRNYLKFDLVVSDATGNKQQLSKTLLKKSGGETQTPFYISILASFSQLYKIVETNERNNTVRLIVFDEAFSKMDSERIQESVRLLRNYSLQAIISAPPEKMPDIVPQVDETLCVVRDVNKSNVYNYNMAKAAKIKVG